MKSLRKLENNQLVTIAGGHLLIWMIGLAVLFWGRGRLKRSETGRRKAEEAIIESLKEKEILLREIHHRVKNNFANITSILNLQDSRVKGVESKNLIKDIQIRMRTMALIHEKLYQSMDIKYFNFGDYIKTISTELPKIYNTPAVKASIKTDVEDIKLDIKIAVPCGLLLNELITNALKHAFPEDRDKTNEIIVSFHERENYIELSVIDNGIGIPEGFDIETNDSLGLMLVTLLVKQIKGELGISRENGTAFFIRFQKRV